MDLENINSDIIDKVISEMNTYDYNSFLDESTLSVMKMHIL